MDARRPADGPSAATGSAPPARTGLAAPAGPEGPPPSAPTPLPVLHALREAAAAGCAAATIGPTPATVPFYEGARARARTLPSRPPLLDAARLIALKKLSRSDLPSRRPDAQPSEVLAATRCGASTGAEPPASVRPRDYRCCTKRPPLRHDRLRREAARASSVGSLAVVERGHLRRGVRELRRRRSLSLIRAGPAGRVLCDERERNRTIHRTLAFA